MLSFKKVIAYVLLIATLFTATSSAAFAAVSTAQPDVKQEQQLKQQYELAKQRLKASKLHSAQSTSVESDVHAEGVRSYLLSLAAKTLAAAIRYGGEELSLVLKYLDADAAKILKNNSSSIANKLDWIAEFDDLVESVIKDQMYYFLKNSLGVSGGTALMIADAIATVCGILLL